MKHWNANIQFTIEAQSFNEVRRAIQKVDRENMLANYAVMLNANGVLGQDMQRAVQTLKDVFEVEDVMES